MASLVTLASLRVQALQRADMVNSKFVDNSTSPPEIDTYINSSARELYDLITGVYDGYFYKEYSFTTVSPQDTYALPADFYKLLGVDQIINPPTGQAISIKPYQLAERNSYTFLQTFNNPMRVIYIPTMTPLVADGDTFDGVQGWEEYIIVDAAIKMLQKEESDVSVLMAEKQALTQRIFGIAQGRDAGIPSRITDIHQIDPFFYIRIPSMLRYQLLQNNIKLVQTYAVGTVYE